MHRAPLSSTRARRLDNVAANLALPSTQQSIECVAFKRTTARTAERIVVLLLLVVHVDVVRWCRDVAERVVDLVERRSSAWLGVPASSHQHLVQIGDH